MQAGGKPQEPAGFVNSSIGQNTFQILRCVTVFELIFSHY